jgi:hypothetical protein
MLAETDAEKAYSDSTLAQAEENNDVEKTQS